MKAVSDAGRAERRFPFGAGGEGEIRVKVSQSMTKRTEQPRALFAALIEQFHAAVIVVDARGAVVQINRKAETAFGLARDLIARNLPEVLESIWFIEDMSGIIDRIRHTLETGESCPAFDAAAHRRKTGQLEHYEWQLSHLLLPDGGHGVACSLEEISQRRRDEVAAERHARWRDFLADISSQLLLTKQPRFLLDAVFARLAEELELEVHLAFVAIPDGGRLHLTSATGLNSGQLTAVQDVMLTKDLASPLPNVRSEFIFEDIAEQTQQPEFNWLHTIGAKWCIGIPLKAGSQLFGALVMISLSRPHFDAAEIQLIRTVSQLASVSVDRASLLEETRRAKDVAETANRAKDEFLAAVSHELRTPLNPALLIASENASDVSLDTKIRNDFATIARSIALESRLIDDLLDLSRVVTGKHAMEMQPVDVHQALAAAEETVRHDFAAKAITVKKILATSPSIVLGDPLRLQQIFWNIFRNAAKFAPPASVIKVETRTTAQEIHVSISDEGIGMTDDQISHVFERFWQGPHSKGGPSPQFGGLGLGLPISRRLVEAHSGTIRAVSPGPNGGTTFVVKLPLARASQLPLAVAEAATTNTGLSHDKGAKRVLLVEDHQPTRLAVQRLLERRNYSVVTAGSAAEARAVFADQPFDLLICDIGLPDATGCDLMRDLKQIRDIPGIAVTGYGAERDVEESLRAGFSAHIMKPMTVKALADALNRVQTQRTLNGSADLKQNTGN